MIAAPARAWAPATVSNVACGFDVLGFALEGPGDEVVATPTSAPGVLLDEIVCDGGRLARDVLANTASVAVAHLLQETGYRSGVALRVKKGIPLASGLGSSAASAVAAVVAANAALELGAGQETLIRSAIEAERRVASGTPHGDNVVPSLLGGFVLLHGAPSSPGIVRLPVPEGLACAVLHPEREIRTAEARAILGDSVPLRAAVAQSGRLGALVAALYEGDLDLLSQALIDEIAEPKRAALVPGFPAVKRAAVRAGALGCSLSGAGPSLFALCRSVGEARAAGEAMRAAMVEAGGVDGEVLVSRLGAPGAHLVNGAVASGLAR